MSGSDYREEPSKDYFFWAAAKTPPIIAHTVKPCAMIRPRIINCDILCSPRWKLTKPKVRHNAVAAAPTF